MKKSFTAFLAMLIALTAIASFGCSSPKGNANATQQPDKDNQNIGARTTISPNPADVSGELRAANKDTYVVKSEEGFENYGFTCFIAGADSEYSVAFDTDGDAVEWKVYVLEDKFPDANRYLPQAYEPSLTESGKLNVTKGQYVYVQCSVSAMSASEPHKGAAVTFVGAGLPKN